MNNDVLATRPDARRWANITPFRGESFLGNAFYSSRVKQPFILAGRIKNRDHVFDETSDDSVK